MMNKIVILILLNISLWGLDFTGEIDFSKINATSHELVYDTDGDKVSELFWRLNNVELIGLKASLESKNHIKLNASVKMNYTDSQSAMDDYDWIDGYTPSSSGYTHWSHHDDTTVEEVTKIDFNIEAPFIYTKHLNIYGMFGQKFDTYKWSASGGFYEYSSNNFERVYFDDEKVIDYEQSIQATYVGIGINYRNFYRFTFNSSLKYSPNVSVEAKDTHYLRNDEVYPGVYADGIYFVDDCYSGEMIEFNIEILYALTSDLSLNLGYTQTEYKVAKGTTTAYYLGTDYEYTTSYDSAGASQSSDMYTVGLQYKF